jgi:hypothetical protein
MLPPRYGLFVLCSSSMTRAALLPLLTAPESLSVAAVQDLEQLAQAFPYCQTAHLLLAKAAHDQGSMLAGQRLRRAATYAADRQLLRQLLEHAAISPATLVDTVSAVKPVAELGVATTSPEPVIGLTAIPTAIESEALPGGGTDCLPSLSGEVDKAQESGEKQRLTVRSEAAESEQVPLEPEDKPAPAEAETVVEPALVALVVEESIETAAPSGLQADSSQTAAADSHEEAEVLPLPIRPSVEAGTARFEFGLNPNLETEFSSYQLPELVADAPVPASAALQQLVAVEPASYIGAADLAYSLAGGSRLGYAMQFTPADAEVAGTVEATLTPASSLPPAGAFFEPDALLLEHLANQPPPAPPAPSSGELIESFLRRTPQRRRGIVTLLTVPEQADLSMRSTRTEPDLASESLARILAGQGKIDRAISVYERLMVRQPEKSTYFAVQIELLRNPPTPSS